MILPRLQYITHPNEDFSDLSWVSRLADGGVEWIQLRIKEDDLEKFHPHLHYKSTFIEIAELMQQECHKNKILLTINDHADVLRFSSADGLHFGLTDNLTKEDLSDISLIGCTAHTLDDMLSYKNVKVDYFGVGPLRKTETKSNTKKALGLDGYQSLLIEMKNKGLEVPVFAIGGIAYSDIEGLVKAGVYGIAVSGLFFKEGHDASLVRKCLERIKEFTHE